MWRLPFYLLLIWLGFRFVRWALRYLESNKSESMIRTGNDKMCVDDLVKDPVCGKFVPVKNSISTVKNGNQVHFCSEACLKQYLDQ